MEALCQLSRFQLEEIWQEKEKERKEERERILKGFQQNIC